MPHTTPTEYTAVQRQCFERDKWRCRHCGRRNGLHTHHIIFRSRGGLDVLWNLITICYCCHDKVHSEKLRMTGNANEQVLVKQDIFPEGYEI
jgi:5-methylcytosine-specific restriction endonuclease McrA